MEDPASNGEAAVASVKTWLSDDATLPATPVMRILAALIHLQLQNPIEALKSVHLCSTMEMTALYAVVLLVMCRIDLAIQTWQRMIKQDEEATLTHMIGGYVALYQGKGSEAVGIFQELMERNASTLPLSNGLFVAQALQGNWDVAEGLAKEDASRTTSDPALLINLVVLQKHLRKEGSARYLALLQSKFPSHPWVQTMQAAQEKFDNAAAQMAQ
jgi:lipopolysaccharide biosynthesis regulator YciM